MSCCATHIKFKKNLVESSDEGWVIRFYFENGCTCEKGGSKSKGLSSDGRCNARSQEM